jgi:glycosyltransferase involved in cell wall biosynthesis
MTVRSQASLLAVTSELPWPLDSGGHLRTFHLLRSLATQLHVRLVAGVTDGGEADLSSLQDAGITVVPARISRRVRWREGIRALNALVAGDPYVMYRRHSRSAVWRALRAEVQTRPPDLLYLDHLDSMLFADLAGNSRVIVDLHNVYSLLVSRAADEHGSRIAAAYLHREARLLARVERAAAARADLLMTVSEREADYFRSLGSKNAVVVPNGVDCDVYASLPVGRPASPSPGLLFLGGLNWAPNVSAAKFLATSVLPSVRHHFASATLRIVGRGSSPELLALRALPGVELVGPVPDVRPYLAEASLLAVPLDAGGGTRLKILEAFAAGLPVVSTAIGCEGIAAEHGRHLTVAERPGFADAVATVLRDPESAGRRAAAARELASCVYDWRVVGSGALSAVLALS